MKHHACTVFALTALLCCHGAAHASVLSHDTLLAAQNESLTVSGMNVAFSVTGGQLQEKTVAGYAGVGVSGGNVGGEIDGDESISFTFDDPTYVTALSLAFLFTAGNYGDVVNEMAVITTDAGTFTLEAVGPTNAAWSGFGEVTNLSPGDSSGAGLWTITGTNIFGAAINTLTLSAGNAGSHSSFGDYAFHSMIVASVPVPAPGAAALLLAAAAVGRSRRRN